MSWACEQWRCHTHAVFIDRYVEIPEFRLWPFYIKHKWNSDVRSQGISSHDMKLPWHTLWRLMFKAQYNQIIGIAWKFCMPILCMFMIDLADHDDVIKWKHFLCYWSFVQRIHRSPVNSPHKGQWCGPLMFSLIWVWINGWINNHEAGDLRCHCAYYDIVMFGQKSQKFCIFGSLV